MWRTDGYGLDLWITPLRLPLLRDHCGRLSAWATGTASDRSGRSIRYTVPDDDRVTITLTSATTATFHVESATSVRYLHRVAVLPVACNRPTAQDPLTTFDVFFATFAENYPFFALHGVDWAVLGARYRPRINGRTTGPELDAQLRSMLTKVDLPSVGSPSTALTDRHAGRPAVADRYL